MNSYPSMGSASSIAQFYHQAAAVSAASAGAVGMDSLGSACSQLSSGGLSSVGTGQALSEITRHPWLVPTGEYQSYLITLCKYLNCNHKMKI
jgi:Antp family protein